jgi:hypothetical protein
MRISLVALTTALAASATSASAQPDPSQPSQPSPPSPPSQPPPQPYPAQPPPYYQQPYPYPYPYVVPPPPPESRRLHDTEVIGDFAAVGTLAAIDILIRQNVDNGTAGTAILVAGVAGGAGAGWLLTNNYEVDAGTAHATTIGLLVGAANAALLIEPAKAYTADDVIGLLFLGSALGAGGGFAYGHATHLTAGQSTFLGTTVLLGSATAALGAVLGSTDGVFGNVESGTLAAGLDAGLAAGILIAPTLDWSARRAKSVLAASVIGALVGGALPGLLTKRQDGQSYNAEVISGCMTAGLWGGFGLGILLTNDAAPDPKYAKPPTPGTAPGMTSFAPWIHPGDRATALGVMTGGTW